MTNPCLPKGITRNHTIAEIYTNCVNGSDAEDVFGFSLSPPPNFTGSTNVSFVGTENIIECVSITRKVFDLYSCNPSINCDSDQYLVPHVKGAYVVRE